MDVIESGKQVDVIYTDFSKTFDQVDHVTIIRKFELVCVRVSNYSIFNIFRIINYKLRK